MSPTVSNGRVFLGGAYRLVLYASTCGGLETGPAFAGKGVFYKMRANGWYAGWVHAAAPLIVGMAYQVRLDASYFVGELASSG